MEIIQNNDWILSIDLNGGRIRELKYKKEIVLGSFKRIDEKEGNTHICCPNFGGEGMEKFNLPFHGPFRNLEWKLINKNKDTIEIEVESLGLKIRQIFKLINGFEQTIKVFNLENKNKSINLAIHNYWAAEFGWQNCKLNQMMIDNLIKSDTDRDLLSINILEIPGKKKYRWSIEGFKYQRFWTAFKEIGNEKKYDQNYICIEPSLERQGFLDMEQINLLTKELLEVKQKIEIID